MRRGSRGRYRESYRSTVRNVKKKFSQHREERANKTGQDVKVELKRSFDLCRDFIYRYRGTRARRIVNVQLIGSGQHQHQKRDTTEEKPRVCRFFFLLFLYNINRGKPV